MQAIDRNGRVRYETLRQLFERKMDRLVREAFRCALPGVLYHYTESALEPILRSRALRCTEYREFRKRDDGDGDELQHADRLIVDAARTLLAEFEGGAADAVVRFLDLYEAVRLGALDDTEIYVGCLSHTHTNKHLWNEYATARGYCIGFQMLNEEQYPVDGLLASTFKVEYDADQHRSRVLDAFREAAVISRRANRVLGANNVHLERALFRIAGLANLACKAKDYAPEEEFRIVIVREISKTKPRPPYRDWPLRTDMRPPVLASIHVGWEAGEAGIQLAAELLTSLNYGAEGMPAMPPIVLAER